MRVLLLNQCFYPDVVATAQHLSDLALQLSKRGHSVTVVTADRGYDNPSLRFKRREVWNGITIIRIPSLSWGKSHRWKRAANFSSFLLVCSLRLLMLRRRHDVVVALTSPPLISFLAALYVWLRGGRLCCWIMDLNPDEAIAAGWLKSTSLAARVLQRLMNFSLRRADQVIVLDRFVKKRLRGRVPDEDRRVVVIPPWPLSDVVSYSTEKGQSFRRTHGLKDKFVVMYSGNHSPCHPLDTLLDAALSLRQQCDVVFCFIGGGSEHDKVRQFSDFNKLNNIKCLPYQPLNELSSSLSAADLHVVVVGNPFVGIVHPSKIYDVMELGSRILYIGPEESHVTDLIPQMCPNQLFVAPHGDSVKVVDLILASRNVDWRSTCGQLSNSRSHKVRCSREALLSEMCQIVETTAETSLLITPRATESIS